MSKIMEDTEHITTKKWDGIVILNKTDFKDYIRDNATTFKTRLKLYRRQFNTVSQLHLTHNCGHLIRAIIHSITCLQMLKMREKLNK